MVFGHSIGEVVALCAANVLEFDAIVESYWALYDYWKEAMDESFFKDAGRLAFVHCDEDLLKPVLDLHENVTTAIYISPTIRVLGGKEPQVEEAVKSLQKAGILSQMLPYPAIHTPYSPQTLRLAWEPLLKKITFRLPRIPVYSAAFAEVFPADESAIRSMVRENTQRPLRLWQATQKFYQDGARIFIQLGGGDSLYSQVKANLGVDDVVSVSMDVDFRSAVTQINDVCATLLTNGIMIDLNYLFRHRFAKEIPCDLLMGKRGDEAEIPASAEAPLAGMSTTVFETLDSKGEMPPAVELSNERRMPFVGSVFSYRPGEEVVVRYILDINEDILLKDHVFVHAPGIKPLIACNPVLPMTGGIEMMIEVAACLAPGHGFIGIENLKAQKWIQLEDVETLELRISARVEHYDPELFTYKVQVEIFLEDQTTPAMMATVILGKQYLLSLDLEFEELAHPHPYPIALEEIYRERYLFHGPLYQCITGQLVIGDEGLVGEVKNLPRRKFFHSLQEPEMLTDPALIDAVSQLVGLWAMDQGMFIFPIGIDRMEMYCPPPAKEVNLPVRAQMTRVGSRRLYATIEVQDGRGAVWIRIKNYKFWIYRWPGNVLDFRRFPDRYPLSMPADLPFLPQGAVCRTLSKRDLGDFDLRIAARYVLHTDEMEAYQKLSGNSMRQSQWLLGRIAAKDAVRLWLVKEYGGEMLHPASFVIENDAKGRPFVSRIADFTTLPRFSITHTGEMALAVAHRDAVGIDTESIAPRELRFLENIASPEERSFLEGKAGGDWDEWVTRLWCAKEAMGKLMGTGFEGSPGKLRAVYISRDGSIRIAHDGSGLSCTVKTSRDQERVVALAVQE